VYRKCLVELDLFERYDRQDLEDGMQRGVDGEAFAQDRDQHIDRGCDPQSRLDRVFGSAEEALDAEVAFS